MTLEGRFINDIRTIINSCGLLSRDQNARETVANLLHVISGNYAVIMIQRRLSDDEMAQLKQQYLGALDQVERGIADNDLPGVFLRVKAGVEVASKEKTGDRCQELILASLQLKDKIIALRVKYGDNRLQNA